MCNMILHFLKIYFMFYMLAYMCDCIKDIAQ